jgi:3-oxoacyl-[acyl-carrier protein] reductase
LLRLSLDTCFFVLRAAPPSMKRKRYGRIVNMSSVSGPLVTFLASGAYGAAKAAMIGLTRSLSSLGRLGSQRMLWHLVGSPTAREQSN